MFILDNMKSLKWKGTKKKKKSPDCLMLLDSLENEFHC